MANSHILVGASTNPLQPVVRRISTSDLYYALARGYDDFAAFPSHAVFLCVIYPLVGILLIGLTLGSYRCCHWQSRLPPVLLWSGLLPRSVSMS